MIEREAVQWGSGLTSQDNGSGDADDQDLCGLARVSKAISFGLSGGIVVVLGRMAATGRLPRNIFAGIRIPSTLRSDEAWDAGHQAAASAMTIAGCGPVLVAIALAVSSPGPKARTVLSRIATVWLLGWLGFATIQASRAARATIIS
ncbi:MAG: SdpI family protein [Acidimicrobiales bacterium]